jgi:hypothetical protein
MNHEFTKRKIIVEYVRGVEGPSLYVKGSRVAGPKLLPDSIVIQSFEVDESRLLEALGVKDG